MAAREAMLHAIGKQLAKLFFCSCMISSALLLIAVDINGRYVGKKFHAGSADLSITTPDTVAVLVGLIVLVATVNIALAAMSIPDEPGPSIRAATWQQLISSIAQAGAVAAL